jgi:nucleotide-binding universal stress UspA family protein
MARSDTTCEATMYKDLIVPITATPADADAINVGLDLAKAFDAHLTVLEMVNLPVPAGNPWGLSPDLAMSDVYGKLRAQAEVNASRLRERLGKEAVASEVRVVEALVAEPGRVAAHHAHYADLSIVAGAIGDTAEATVNHAYFGAMLLESGRPVLVVPPRCKSAVPPKRIVLAWRPTREATRALHDALPLLLQADRVDVLAINPVGGELGHGEQPGADIANHLARHGVEANVVVRDARSRGVSGVLLEHARESYAQLIVAGGYGHSRLREWAMGGVTRELLLTASVPVLFSH